MKIVLGLFAIVSMLAMPIVPAKAVTCNTYCYGNNNSYCTTTCY